MSAESPAAYMRDRWIFRACLVLLLLCAALMIFAAARNLPAVFWPACGVLPVVMLIGTIYAYRIDEADRVR